MRLLRGEHLSATGFPPADLDRGHKKDHDKMSKLPGDKFDREYMDSKAAPAAPRRSSTEAPAASRAFYLGGRVAYCQARVSNECAIFWLRIQVARLRFTNRVQVWPRVGRNSRKARGSITATLAPCDGSRTDS